MNKAIKVRLVTDLQERAPAPHRANQHSAASLLRRSVHV